MSHHNFDIPDHLIERFGATGGRPNGRYGEHDEGEIRFGVAADVDRQVVLVDFGKPVRSVGMTPDQATQLADMIRAKAAECRGTT